jgi:diguanylate cyclase (GGDEF)-like protein/PAS domain S-box-containing protein
LSRPKRRTASSRPPSDGPRRRLLERPRFLAHPVVVALLLAAAYFAAGKFGLTLAFVHASATAVWPPTGIALAAFLLLGYRVWPGILLGAFLVNATTAGSVATSLGIALGNTLEGVVGAYLVNRFANGRHAFDQARDIFRFALLAALLSTTVSPTLGVTSLCLGGFAEWAQFRPIWFTWWLGDVAGDLVVAPALVLWSMKRHGRWKPGQKVEGVALLLGLILVGQCVFGGLFPSEVKDYPLEFLCIPLLVWAAFRFGQRGAATATLLLSAIAIRGTLHGFGPFARGTQNEALLLLQAFIGVIAVTKLAIAAVVSERKRVQESLALLESAVQNAEEGVVILNSGSEGSRPRITFASDGFARMTGLTSSEVLGETLEILKFSEKNRDVGDAMHSAVAEGRSFQGEAGALRPDGSEYALELELVPVSEAGETATHWVGILRDVSERAAQRAVLEHQALYDFLTGLPNRALLRDRLDQAILSYEREGVPLTLLMIDLDRFKEINDNFGHQLGDVVLKQIGPRLRSALRTADTIARLGGDEFAILLPKVGDESGAMAMAVKILNALELPFVIEGHSLEISASIGIAICPRHGRDWATLLRRADVAMYAAKKSNLGYAMDAADPGLKLISDGL